MSDLPSWKSALSGLPHLSSAFLGNGRNTVSRALHVSEERPHVSEDIAAELGEF